MITLIEYAEGYEPFFDIVIDGQYRGTLAMEDLEAYTRGLEYGGAQFEIVKEQ